MVDFGPNSGQLIGLIGPNVDPFEMVRTSALVFCDDNNGTLVLTVEAIDAIIISGVVGGNGVIGDTGLDSPEFDVLLVVLDGIINLGPVVEDDDVGDDEIRSI